jgi:GNAT superfamily N-acetyltransferase
MTNILRELTTPCLVTAIEENLYCFIDTLKRWPKAEVHQSPSISWCLSDAPFSLFNSIMRTHLGSEVMDVAIEARIEAARARNVPVSWWTGPSTRPPDLCTHLKRHGFVEVEASPGMAVTLAAVNEPRQVSWLTIEVVRSPEMLRQWGVTCALGFNASGQTADRLGAVWYDLLSHVEPDQVICYLGSLNGEPVATSMLMYGAGVAGIYGVGTIPGARRQGIGAMMTVKPLQDAREAGYVAGILQASQMGHSLYRSLGFREYCKIYEYIWRPEAG